MKILQVNAGALSNFEVFDFLQCRGAGKGPTRAIAHIAPSESKVYDYLKQCAATSQTRESIGEFLESKEYNLTKAEMLNIINITPTSKVEIDPIIENSENRMEENVELSELVLQVFPPPSEVESDPAKTQENMDVPDGQQIEAS